MAAKNLKALALVRSIQVMDVSNPDEQALAVAAQTELTRLIRTVEDARKEAKAPILDAGTRLDKACKDFIATVKQEEIRVAKLVGDFAALELAKVRAAENARLAGLSALERERQDALSKVTDHDEFDRVNEDFNNQAAQLPPIQTVPRADGQQVREDWEITVTDIWTLARAHPACVKIEPRLAEIKSLLKAGVKVAGVTATPVVNASVRLGKEPPAISI
jgi:hypothetical protein